MKKFVGVLLALMLLSVATCAIAESYTGTAPGFGGDITVTITVDDGILSDITAEGPNETQGVGSIAIDQLPAAMLEKGTWDVDALTGCTFSSTGVIEAAKAAFAQLPGADSPAADESAAAEALMTPGTYQATTHGHHSDVVVEVTVSETSVERVEIVSEGETYNLADAALNTIPGAIVEQQSVLVDTVSCATVTSRAILTGVRDCLDQAGGEGCAKRFEREIPKETVEPKDETLDVDVVVVGSGLTGIAAATKAQESGAKVVLLEKNSFFGGISQTAFGGMVLPSNDEAESHNLYNYLMKKGAGIIKGAEYLDNGMYPVESLVNNYIDRAPEMMSWLDELGIKHTDWGGERPIDGYMVGAAIFLYGDAPDNMGMAIEDFVGKFLEKGGELYLNTEATSLLTDESGTVTGVLAKSKDANYTINAKSVVLATGGYGANREMLETYCPAFANDINVTLPSNQGDGIRMALEVGAVMWDDQFCMSGSGHLEMTDADMISGYHDMMASLASIYVSPSGLRLNSEDPSPYTLGATFANPDVQAYYWIINNAEVAESAGYLDLLENHVANGDAGYFKGETLADLARQLKITPNVLRYTLSRYNAMCAAGVDEDCGKAAEYLIAMEEGPWYAAKGDIVMFGTVGGIITNENAEVVDANGNAIPGLFAAGEVSNHGLNNLCYSQNQLGECMVYGMIAGENAAAAAK